MSGVVQAESLIIAPAKNIAGETQTRVLLIGEDGSRMAIDLTQFATLHLAEGAKLAAHGSSCPVKTIAGIAA